ATGKAAQALRGGVWRDEVVLRPRNFRIAGQPADRQSARPGSRAQIALAGPGFLLPDLPNALVKKMPADRQLKQYQQQTRAPVHERVQRRSLAASLGRA